MNTITRVMATISLSLGVFMFVLDYTIANVAIPYIAGGLAASVDEGVYVLTFFAIGNSVVLLLSGWLGSRFGNGRTVTWSIVWFTIFSFLCGMAPSLLSLVVFRFLQGAAAGPLIPLSQALLRQIHPARRLNAVMALFSMIVLVAPVLGPIVGGYFCVVTTWRWIFYINVPIGLICVLINIVTFKSLEKGNPAAKSDLISFLLILVGMTTLQIFLDKGQTWDWFNSYAIELSFIVAVVTLLYLFIWSFISKDPLIRMYLFRIRNFSLATAVMALFYSSYMGTVVLIPLWLQTYMGYDALNAGIAVSSIGIGAVFTASLTVKIIEKYGRILPLIVGCIIIGISNLMTRFFYTDVGMYQILLTRFYLGCGVGLVVSPLMGLPVLSLPPEELSHGLGMFHFIRGVFGAIGTSVYTTLFYRRTVHQHHNLVDTFTSYNPHATDYMHAFQGLYGESRLTAVNALLDQQASAVALDEVFLLMTWVSFFLCLLIIVVYKKPKPGTPAPVTHVVSD